AGPVALFLCRRAGLLTSTALSVATMCMSALLIHLGRGMIELHFHILVMLALLVVFGSPIPLIAAGAVIAAHHAIFYLFLPASVFNYQASWVIVALHAVFVIAEVGPCAWIAVRFGRFVKAQELATTVLA